MQARPRGMAPVIASAVVAAAIGVDVLLSACGGGGGSTSPTPIPVVFIVTISSSGLSQTDLVAPSDDSNALTPIPDEVFIRFNNIDAVAHDIRSDPHPDHTNCPALNVEVVAAGGTVVTPILNQCLGGRTQQGFHDETRPEDVRFYGRIRRQR